MLRKILIQSLAIFGLTSAAMANDFYFGVSAVDTEYDEVGLSIDNNGHAVTFGMNLDMLSGVNTALEVSYGDLLDTSISGVAVSAETLDISILASFGSGNIRPFGRLGFSDGEVKASAGGASASADDTTEIWGLGADFIVSDTSFIRLEMTDAEYEDVVDAEVETIRLGVFTRF
jgi:hypothetical protein|tara:strand:+ start:414 stop:935 length:522 start_codon:yes stop_codon:yes gene_type:complete